MDKISDTENCQGAVCVCPLSELSLKLESREKISCSRKSFRPVKRRCRPRTAEALGVDGILVCGGCDPFGPKGAAGVHGSAASVSVGIFPDISSAAERLCAAHVPLYCSVVSNSDCKIGELDFSVGRAVIIGNEASGASARAKELSEKLFTIPMSGRAESLNAAAAAAIIIYEMTKG